MKKRVEPVKFTKKEVKLILSGKTNPQIQNKLIKLNELISKNIDLIYRLESKD